MVFHQPFNSLSSGNYNAVTYTDQFWNYHFHKNPEIICVLRGSVEVSVSGRSRVLSEGDFAMCLSCEIIRLVTGTTEMRNITILREGS